MAVHFNDIPSWDAWKKASSSFLQSRAAKPKLVRIDDLIRAYPNVPGSKKRSALVDLSLALYEWAADKLERDVGTGRLEAMQALEKIVQKKLVTIPPSG